MGIEGGIFGNRSVVDQRFIPDYTALARQIEALKAMGLKIVLTQGSFDWLHAGHYAYLERAKEQGDILVVGADSDEKIRARKGPDRPLLPEHDRVVDLAQLRYVDLITLKPYQAPKWELIKVIRPNVLVAIAETYTPEQIAELERDYCGEVILLPYTKTVSTSAKIRDLYLRTSQTLAPALASTMLEFLSDHGDEILGRALDKTTSQTTQSPDE